MTWFRTKNTQQIIYIVYDGKLRMQFIHSSKRGGFEFCWTSWSSLINEIL